MIQYRESKISAYHNYLVNGMLTPGFFVGNPNSEKGFYFLADVLPSGESAPRISARIIDDQGVVLLELDRNRVRKNQGGYAHKLAQDGFRILQPSGESFLEVATESFAKGYLTRVRATLFDGSSNLRIEPSGESIQVLGDTMVVLTKPFRSGIS